MRPMPDDDWDDADDVADIADEMSLDSLDLLSEVTNEIRGSLLRRMARPITVAELAARDAGVSLWRACAEILSCGALKGRAAGD